MSHSNELLNLGKGWGVTGIPEFAQSELNVGNLDSPLGLESEVSAV